MKMKVGVDLDGLTLRSGGIGRYAVNLVNYLSPLLKGSSQDKMYVFFHRSFEKRLIQEESRLELIPELTFIKSNVLRKGVFLPFSLRRWDLDLFHGVDHVGLPFLYKNKNCRYVVTIHDLITRIFPYKFSFKHRFVQNSLLSLVLKKADKVIAVSHTTKEDLLRFYPWCEGKIKVIYEGVEPHFYPRSRPEIKRIMEKYNIDQNYFLFLGTVEPRKNIGRVVEAFIQFKREIRTEQKLVITGRKGWLYKGILDQMNQSPFSRDILFTGFIEDEDLPSLYSGAELFLYPSLYEGFGLPLLEAMACGAPVITSNVSSLGELGGGVALLVNPRNVDEMVQEMKKLIKEPRIKEKMRKKGLERTREFTWKKAAEETFRVYKEILG